MSRLALYLLGPPRIELDGEPVHIGRRKAVALLAYLAVTGQSRSADASASVHSRDTLATLLWPGYDQSGARGRLRRTLSTLNRALGQGWLTSERETIGQLFEDIAGHHIGAATASLPPQVFAAAQERGRALDWWATAEALLNELDW